MKIKVLNKKMRHACAIILLALGCVVSYAEDTARDYPVPTERQLDWHDTDMYAFIHHGPNTFVGRDWGYGDTPAEVFNPKDFNADEMVAALKKAGFKGVVITAKHHDGFCLWPTKTTDYNITQSPWRDGKGDMVKEIADACRKQGMKLGIYVSPWDRNSPYYGKPEYVEIFHNQIKELLTQYGDLFLVWFDGANGGDGYYGGANEKRTIDKQTYYQWDKVNKMIRELQPKANVFSDIGPDVRWVGNESGFANYPHWSTFTPEGNNGRPAAPGDSNYRTATTGHADGKLWIPAEVDVSIRPRWFWHKDDDNHVRSSENLLTLYLQSVGRGANLNLNIPPDHRGVITDQDKKSLEGFKALLDQLYSVNYAEKAKVNASSETQAHEAQLVLDRKRDNYWQAAQKPTCEQDETLTLTLPKQETFSVIRLAEPIQLGQHIRKFTVDVKQDGKFVPWIIGESIGARVILVGKEVTTDEVRITIQESDEAPALSEVSLWKMPVILSTPKLTIDKNNSISLKGGMGSTIHYTTDGSEPTPESPEYVEPFTFSKGGILKAASFHQGKSSSVMTEVIPVTKTDWKIVKAESRAADPALLIDGNNRTLWHTHTNDGPIPLPQEVIVDMGKPQEVGAFIYVPRTDCQNGTIDLYELYLSDDGEHWGKPVLDGEFSNIKNNPIPQVVRLKKPQQARYFKFVAKRAIDGTSASVSELGILPPLPSDKN